MWTAWRPRALVAAASMTRARLPCARAATRTPGTLGSPRASGPPIPTQSTSSAADRVSDCTAQKAIAIDATPASNRSHHSSHRFTNESTISKVPRGIRYQAKSRASTTKVAPGHPKAVTPPARKTIPSSACAAFHVGATAVMVNSVPATRQSTTPVRIAIDPTEVRLNCRMASDSSIHAQPLTSRSHQYLVAPARLVAKRDPRCAASSQ